MTPGSLPALIRSNDPTFHILQFGLITSAACNPTPVTERTLYVGSQDEIVTEIADDYIEFRKGLRKSERLGDLPTAIFLCPEGENLSYEERTTLDLIDARLEELGFSRDTETPSEFLDD